MKPETLIVRLETGFDEKLGKHWVTAGRKKYYWNPPRSPDEQISKQRAMFAAFFDANNRHLWARAGN